MNLPYLQSLEGEDPVIVEAEFRASPSRVFRAWTNPEEIKRWFGAGEGGPEQVTVEPKEGGLWKYTFAEKDGQVDSLGGRFTRVEPDARLDFTWVHTRVRADGELEQSGESTVSVEFAATENGTTVRVVHRAVAERGSRENIGSGWGISFDKLLKLVEA